MKTNWALRYTIEPGNYNEEDAGEFMGLCDSIVVGSITNSEDGSSSYMFLGVHGETQIPMTDTELFKAWTVLGSQLADSPNLEPTWRDIANKTLEAVRKIIVPGNGAN